jgi:MoaA/NifB/PqqE/SkfB family radical SAM enzyme
MNLDNSQLMKSDKIEEDLTYTDCRYPWHTVQILADGQVRPCCWSTRSLGNLHDSELEEIWNGRKCEDLRQHILNGKIHEICTGAPCVYVQNEMRKKDGLS